MRGTPTSNWTVSTAIPGRDTENTCSTPAIWASTCSAGVEISVSTSFAEAPGNGMNTFAIVTLICGSSSRGVPATAKSPASRATSAMSGVRRASWKNRAMRPERPMALGRRRAQASAHRLERDALARLEAGKHFDDFLVAGRPEPHLAQLRQGRAGPHAHRGHLAAPHDRLARNEQARLLADHEMCAREHARIDAAHVVRQLDPDAGSVRARV